MGCRNGGVKLLRALWTNKNVKGYKANEEPLKYWGKESAAFWMSWSHPTDDLGRPAVI